MSRDGFDSAQAAEVLRCMLLIRRFEERALKLRLAGAIYGSVHPYIGQEAVAVGICSALSPDDYITSNHRNHGHCLAKGADPSRMMAELYGRTNGYCHGKGGSMHLVDIERGILGADGIIGANGPYALGCALASQYDGLDEVTVCFTSDGATGQGAMHEALNLSALWKSPVVWVCENNQYASGTPRSEGFAATSIANMGLSYDIPSHVVDGTNVTEVGQIAQEAVARARAGDGPTFIEARVYRWGSHTQKDKLEPEARPAGEVARWRARDPIALFQAELLDAGKIDETSIVAITEAVEQRIDEAVAFAEAGPMPTEAEVTSDVFA